MTGDRAPVSGGASVEPTKELVDALYADKVRAARQTPMEERFLAGPRLFDFACQLMRAGIRMSFPTADESEVERELDRRLSIKVFLENRR